MIAIAESILGQLRDLEEGLLDEILLVDLAIKVYVQLYGHFSILEQSSQGFKYKIQKLNRRLFLFQHLDDVFFKEEFNRRQTFSHPVLYYRDYEDIDMFEVTLVFETQGFLEDSWYVSTDEVLELQFSDHEEMRFLEKS